MDKYLFLQHTIRTLVSIYPETSVAVFQACQHFHIPRFHIHITILVLWSPGKYAIQDQQAISYLKHAAKKQTQPSQTAYR